MVIQTYNGRSIFFIATQKLARLWKFVWDNKKWWLECEFIIIELINLHGLIWDSYIKKVQFDIIIVINLQNSIDVC